MFPDFPVLQDIRGLDLIMQKQAYKTTRFKKYFILIDRSKRRENTLNIMDNLNFMTETNEFADASY